MGRRHYSSSAADTTLSGSINAGATSITVGSITGHPVQFPYPLILDPETATEEVVDVTGGTGTNLTITRGVDGTTALSHTAGAVVRHGVSARDYDESNDHINSTDGVHGITGDVVGTTDAQVLTDKTIDLTDNTVNGTLAEFSAAVSDADLVGVDTVQAVTNKDLSDASNTFPDAFPLGVLGYAEVTASQASITAEADLTDLSVAVTPAAGRRVRVTASVSPASTGSNEVVIVRIKEGATVLQARSIALGPDVNLSGALEFSVILEPTAAAHTYKVSMARNAVPASGSVSNTASATQPSFILVEDIGAA